MRWIAPALLFAAGSVSAADPVLTVGFASADITPALGGKPVYLAGFGPNRPATAVFDRLHVRAVVLHDGTTKVAIASADVVGLFLPTAERIRAKLPGFGYVLVTATHNHDGPDTLGLWGRSPFQCGIDPDYLADLESKVVRAVQAADTARMPATALVGTARAPELLADHRLPMCKLDELVAVRFDAPDTGKRVGVIIQWNCHPETLGSKNTAISSDFVGPAVKYLENAEGCPVVYLTGAVGGMMTSLGLEVRDDAGKPLADGTVAKTERYGRRVGEVAADAVRRAVPARLTPFDIRTRSVLIPVENPLYRLAWKMGTLKRPIYHWAGEPTPARPREADDIGEPVAVRTEVGRLRLGELDVAVIPGEIYPELVLGRVQDPPDLEPTSPAAPPEPAVYAHCRGNIA